MDVFGIGYVGQEHADYLMGALKIYYEKIMTDCEEKLYCGITIKLNHTIRYVDIQMPGYIKEALNQFNNKTPKIPQHQPYPEPERTYSADSQKMKPINTSPELSTE